MSATSRISAGEFRLDLARDSARAILQRIQLLDPVAPDLPSAAVMAQDLLLEAPSNLPGLILILLLAFFASWSPFGASSPASSSRLVSGMSRFVLVFLWRGPSWCPLVLLLVAVGVARASLCFDLASPTRALLTSFICLASAGLVGTAAAAAVFAFFFFEEALVPWLLCWNLCRMFGSVCESHLISGKRIFLVVGSEEDDSEDE